MSPRTFRTRATSASRTSASRSRRHHVAKGMSKGTRAMAKTRVRKAMPTRTMVKRRRPAFSGGQSHYSVSSCNYGIKPKKLIVKSAIQNAPNTIDLNSGGILTTPGGYQAVSGIANCRLSLFDVNDLLQMEANVQDMTQNIPGNPSQAYQTQYVIHGGSAELTLKNDTNGMNVVRLYDIIVRRDTGKNLHTNDIMEPDKAWQIGDIFAGREGGINQIDATNYKTIGATPFESKTFTTFFKVAKVTKIVMDPGSIHCHRVKYFPNRLWSNTAELQDTIGFRGLTVYTMVVAEGEPCVATSGGDGGVTTTPVKLVMTLKKRFTYQPLYIPYQRVSFQSLLPGVPAQLMNAETAVKTTFDQA